MSYIPAIYGTVDSNNSSSSLLTANTSFTGISTLVTNYSNIIISITSDQNSQTGGFQVQFSPDNSNWDIVRSQTFQVSTTGTNFNVVFPAINVESQYYRVIYTNGQFNQTTFRLQSLLNAQSSQSTTILQPIEGTLQYLSHPRISNKRSLNVKIAEPISSFGEIRTIEPTPVTSFNFVYGLNSNYNQSFSTGAGSSATGTSNQLGSVTSGTGSNGTAYISSLRILSYLDGLGGLIRFTAVFTTPGIANNIQIAGPGGPTGGALDGYFFGYNGTSFGILYKRNGVSNWTTQNNWNMDTLLGNGGASNSSGMLLVPNRGNIYQIKTSYLGFANIEFEIYNALTASFVVVHNLQYAGLNSVPIVTNPAFQMTWNTKNSAVTTASTNVSGGSCGLFIDGPQNIHIGAKYSQSNSKSISNTTETNVLTIRNNTTINGIANNSPILLGIISVASSSGNNTLNVVYRLKLNATVTGSSFTNIDSVNSIASFDVAGTTLSGGTLQQSICTNNQGSQIADLTDFNIYLSPGDTMVISAELSSANATSVTVAINWVELTY